jgi:phosphatidate cytidylyltransferase
MRWPRTSSGIAGMAATPEGGRWAALRRRFITAGVGGPILLALVWLGGWPLWILSWVLALVMSYEFSGLLVRRRLELPVWAIGTLVTGILATVALRWPLMPAVVGLFFLAALFGLGGDDNQRGFMTGQSALFGAIYIGALITFLPRIRGLPHGLSLTVFVLLTVWATDAAAYFIGNSYGRHRMFPRVSPGKTWEGSLAGLGGGALAGLILSTWLVGSLGPGIVVAVGISVASQLGDLVESNLKRFVDAKDAGGILPGHGGLLDRLDSALFALPAAYYLLRGMGLS